MSYPPKHPPCRRGPFMRWSAWILGKDPAASGTTGTPVRPVVEGLEERVVPYATSGNLWPAPQRVTISFVPDGTNLGGQTSNMFATFNAKFGSAATWQDQILKAAQLWAQQSKLNFTVVSDNGAASGSGSYQQGDTNFGDIRIGGYSFSDSNLAIGYYPPQGNNYSIAGDFCFNTAKAFNINGSDYDLFTVALHEFGHTLGLGHSTTTAATMYSTYNGKDTALNADDISGIKAIYAARAVDSYDQTASNGTFAAATNITSLINTTNKNAVVNSADITTTSDIDYYKFTVPTGLGGTLTVNVQSTNLSLLAPMLKVYNSSNKQVGTTITGSGYGGSTIQLQVSVTAGSLYAVMVDGKDTTANGTGAYAVTLIFPGGTAPTVTIPATQRANGSPLTGGGGIAQNLAAALSSKRAEAFEVDPNYIPVDTPPADPVPADAGADLASTVEDETAPRFAPITVSLPNASPFVLFLGSPGQTSVHFAGNGADLLDGLSGWTARRSGRLSDAADWVAEFN